MLLFICAGDSTYAEITEQGLRSSEPGYRLVRSFEKLRSSCHERILVVEFSEAELEQCQVGEHIVIAPVVPLASFRNSDPFVPVERITAGGGLVVTHGDVGPQVLLIHRRGAWDLPKGKLDPGESIEQCARREVVEELGLDDGDLEVVCPAGNTIHGYREGENFMLKTTHWFLMRTTSSDFRPQTDEGIDQVEWVAWSEAQERVGFDTLRDLLKRTKLLASEMTPH